MKGFILTISFFILTLCGFGQEYLPFDFEKGRWISNYWCGESDDNISIQYYTKGDTLINDQLFKKLFCYSKNYKHSQRDPIINNSYVGAVRNNENKQVEYLESDLNHLVIIYDFNLQIGDTIKNGFGQFNCVWEFSGCSNNMPLVVITIDSINYCERYHKRFVFEQYDGHDQYLIEGIGFNDGFMFPQFQPFEIITSLDCYTEVGNSDCEACDLLLSSHEIDFNSSLSINPNPTNGLFSLKSNEQIEKIEIYDLLGNLVYKDNSCPVVPTIHLDLPNGIYLVKVKTFNDHLFSRKVVVKKEL